MVSIREGVVNDVPGLLEREHLLIDQNSQQLNGGNGWMSIVKLNLVLVGKHGEPIVMSQFVSPDDIINGG